MAGLFHAAKIGSVRVLVADDETEDFGVEAEACVKVFH
jgi:hypothetical protein